MAQRKSPASRGPGAGKSSAPSSKPGSRPAGSKPSANRTASSKPSLSKPESAAGSASRPPSSSRAPRPAGGGRPPNRKPGKSIVNQKQTPWGLIWTTVAIVVFAAAVVVAVVVTRKDSSSTAAANTSTGGQKVDRNDPYRQPESAAAKAIAGVTYRVEGQHNHVTGTVKYDSTPPVGGNHNGFWADCTGTVYPQAIANENAVHMLEHGAIWITYNPKTLSASGLTALKKYVAGVDRMALSPYPSLKTPISLQSWGYQLFVSKASDPRIPQFISALRYNQKVTPEYGATCSNPTFKQKPSTFGHPTNG